MTQYAKETQVSPEKSRMEIESTLRKYGCAEFAFMTGPAEAKIGFRINDRSIRFTLPLPSITEFEMHPKFSWKRRSAEQQKNAWDQAVRQRWRALALGIKAKLECVETGITTFDEEFLAHIVTETGETIGERMVPILENPKFLSQRLLSWDGVSQQK